ncbi:MAG: hypothetical protein D6740_02535 [Alphaproteobacteria bacterium]|nr:MAG: hypothetical protein D6740_02535 [Alphaproteobacteria bacterium]
MSTGRQPGNPLPAGPVSGIDGGRLGPLGRKAEGGAVATAGKRISALPDPATFAMLVVQLILLGLFAHLLRDLRFDAARTQAALAGLADGFSHARAIIASDNPAQTSSPPLLAEAAAIWKSAERERLGRLARMSWLARPGLALILSDRALFARGGGRLSLTAERWLAPTVDLLERHPGALLLLARSTQEDMGSALAHLSLLRADLRARGAPVQAVALRLDEHLSTGQTALVLVMPAAQRERRRP